jgi:hypothetical protein
VARGSGGEMEKGKDAGRMPAIRFKIQTFAVNFILSQKKTHSKYSLVYLVSED